jgi:sugar phosphate isomerase/epimerase
MRFRHPDGSTVHLSYCTNVHPATDVDGVVGQLGRYAAAVRHQLGVRRLGVGLWLASDAATQLSDTAGGARDLRDRLDELGLEVVTLNGFPYQHFHADVVKLAVYEPDWASPLRADYTLRLASILADVLPDDVDAGSISTLPLAWRTPWDDDRSAACREQLQRVAAGLADLHERTGKHIRVALEPEPGCIVETTAQAMAVLADLPDGYLGMCLDVCHLAVQFEDPPTAVAAAGDRIVKAQVACALRVDVADPAAREALSAFDERRFLHQTRTRTGDGVVGVDDLPDALAGALPGEGEWRVHFHTAIHAGAQPPVETTQDVLRETLAELVGKANARARHLEVETYTWTVLPVNQRPADDDALVRSLAAELAWAREQLTGLGLEEIS